MQGVKRKRRNTHSPADIARAAERKGKAWQLRMAGASYQQIGDELGIAWQTARKYIVERLEALDPKDPNETKQMRREETARLDGDLLAMARARQVGDPTAIARAVSISARKAAMWGLDAPTKVEGDGSLMGIQLVISKGAVVTTPDGKKQRSLSDILAEGEKEEP